MRKKQKNKAKTLSISRGTIIFIAIIVVAAGGGIYYLLNTSTPVNEKYPVFATPSHIYIVGVHDPTQGYVYEQESTRQARKAVSGGVADAAIHIPRGTLVALHFINEDKDTGASMDLNIDNFNVHTSKLNYFQAQTVTFLADKEGTYSYYSNLHPEMKGSITVDP
ncbi:MAG: cupredoxin domain-containing protein [Thaumarchaeota archaeon]|nr:cupredoxin domain-containing protein [Nitrososphaerota archaeon]MDE1866639.1 cupredoxin domain-containing protein [Nitrososphaerota archaeon]